MPQHDIIHRGPQWPRCHHSAPNHSLIGIPTGRAKIPLSPAVAGGRILPFINPRRSIPHTAQRIVFCLRMIPIRAFHVFSTRLDGRQRPILNITSFAGHHFVYSFHFVVCRIKLQKKPDPTQADPMGHKASARRDSGETAGPERGFQAPIFMGTKSCVFR